MALAREDSNPVGVLDYMTAQYSAFLFAEDRIPGEFEEAMSTRYALTINVHKGRRFPLARTTPTPMCAFQPSIAPFLTP